MMLPSGSRAASLISPHTIFHRPIYRFNEMAALRPVLHTPLLRVVIPPLVRRTPAVVPARAFVRSPIQAAKPLPPRPTINEDEIEENFLKGSGPGGQAINKTNSAVQLKHLPTGIVIKSQATRSREQNRKIARRLLAERIEELELGPRSRTAIKAAVKQKKKASKTKKARRKYRKLEEEKKVKEHEGGESLQDSVVAVSAANAKTSPSAPTGVSVAGMTAAAAAGTAATAGSRRFSNSALARAADDDRSPHVTGASDTTRSASYIDLDEYEEDNGEEWDEDDDEEDEEEEEDDGEVWETNDYCRVSEGDARMFSDVQSQCTGHLYI
ncbi:RF-1 domain-containing protein [Lineolata rhizophorae]|uniref:RF-1 domain-containing protein n=1 Tax=Lineolata rhizophorae TaxID=578093 RepID=A0A6A6NST0_9PEZI|nr:RF-1 domain-containing protein [Lineolata rhizophorae]